MQRRLGDVKIVEQADQGGKNLPRFGAVEGGQVTAADRLHAKAAVSRVSFASVELQLGVKPTAQIGGERFAFSFAVAEGWRRMPVPSPLHQSGGYARCEYDSGRYQAG